MEVAVDLETQETGPRSLRGVRRRNVLGRACMLWCVWACVCVCMRVHVQGWKTVARFVRRVIVCATVRRR